MQMILRFNLVSCLLLKDVRLLTTLPVADQSVLVMHLARRLSDYERLWCCLCLTLMREC